MKKIQYFFAVMFFAIAVSCSAYAATDCIYSAEYTYDSGFEGAEYDPNCGWIPYHSTTTAAAEFVTAATAGEKAVFEGKHAIRFSNMPNQGGGRGIYYKPGTAGQTAWNFNAGDTVEISGMFRTDVSEGAQIWFGEGSNAFSVQTSKDVGDDWVYISGRYTFPADGIGGFRINTNIDTNSGYIYADNISIKRVLFGGEKAAAVRIEQKDGVYAAIDAKGNLYMWGKGTDGILNAENTEITKPQRKMTGVADIVLGGGHAVVLKKNGMVFTWGRNDYGQLGDGTVIDRTEPVFVASGIKSIAAGEAHTVLVDQFGCAYGVGRNTSCQYISGDAAYRTSFEKIDVDFYVNCAWASGEHTFLKSSLGYIYGIGYNGNAQLGNGSFLPQLRYQKLSENRLLDLDTTDSCTVCLGYDRKLYAAGFARHGQFGAEDAYETLTAVYDRVDACSIGETSMFLLNDGKAAVLGGKTAGLAGDGSTPSAKLNNAVFGVVDSDVLYLTDTGDLYSMEGMVLTSKSTPETVFPDWDGERMVVPFGLVFDLDGGIVYHAESIAGGVTVLLAAYDEAGKLIHVSMTDHVSNEKVNISSLDCDVAEYKVMIWNNTSNMIPIENAHLITFAEISAAGSQADGLWQLKVSGTTAAIDGVRQGETKVTLVVYDKDKMNDPSGIRALEQLTTDADGSFECKIPILGAPSECILQVGISGGILEKSIEN